MLITVKNYGKNSHKILRSFCEIKKVILNAPDRFEQVALRFQSGQAKGSIGFIDRAISGDPWMPFVYRLARRQSGLSGIAGAGVDFVENDHD